MRLASERGRVVQRHAHSTGKGMKQGRHCCYWQYYWRADDHLVYAVTGNGFQVTDTVKLVAASRVECLEMMRATGSGRGNRCGMSWHTDSPSRPEVNSDNTQELGRRCGPGAGP